MPFGSNSGIPDCKLLARRASFQRREAMAQNKDIVVDIAGKHLKVSNLDKVLYPEVGFTKGQVIDYFVRIAPVLLPHLHGRPLTMKRYPNGVNGPYFYEKNCPSIARCGCRPRPSGAPAIASGSTT